MIPAILWRDIRESLWARRSRTLLSFTAICIGMTCLSMLASVLDGLNARGKMMASELGAQVIAVEGENLGRKHIETCKASLPGVQIEYITRYRIASANLQRNLDVNATGPELLRIKNWPLLNGRFLDPVDLRQRAQVCVISASLQEQYQLSVNGLLLLENTPFRIVGILGSQGSADIQRVNGQAEVYIPHTVYPTWINEAEPPGIDLLFVQWPEPAAFEGALPALQNVFQADMYSEQDRLTYITPEVVLSGIRQLQFTLKVSLGTVAILCLCLGGCTLMALMVATVKERISEIGLRFSLGASKQDIYQLFMGEALFITALAAGVGTPLGYLLIRSLRQQLDLPLHISFSSMILPVAAALALAGLFTFWPAWQAARIRPADALRYE